MESILSVQSIRVTYDGAEALRGVSIEVRESLIVALIGANGAGKTTVLRAISGLVPLKSGEIWFKRQKLDKLAPPEIVRRGVVHVPAGRRVFPYMAVLDNLMMGAYLRRGREVIASDLDMVFGHFPVLKGRLRQKAGSLSGGEQQMLAIGRALMATPKLMLLDEPTLGLSPVLVQATAKIINDINIKQKVTVLLVEQNAKMALTMAEWAYVLETGTVALEGNAKNLIINDHVRKAYLGEQAI